MEINIGRIQSETAIAIKTLDTENKSVETSTCDFEKIKDQNLNVLFFENVESFENQASLLKSEESLYPIVELGSLQIESADFDGLDYQSLFEAYEKINTRWILSNNMQTVETLCTDVVKLKEQLFRDRNQFFESFWKVLKSNLATTDLNIIFHDLKEPTAAAKEKGEKPTLAYGCVKGQKTPAFSEGSDLEKSLMNDYKDEFKNPFSITEFDTERNQLVMTGHIDQSPILMMAKVSGLNQLQRSVLSGLMDGLQK